MSIFFTLTKFMEFKSTLTPVIRPYVEQLGFHSLKRFLSQYQIQTI